MLLNQGVNQACDWWSLGILLYEMVHGEPPFTDPDGNDMVTYSNIAQGTLSSCYPDDSPATIEVRALCQGLCTVKVAYRLGYLKGGAKDVMDHAWFGSDYDWSGLINMCREPPWRPNLSASDDTTFFDDAGGGESLDGPQGRQPPEELAKRWELLQYEYAGGMALQHMSHLA